MSFDELQNKARKVSKSFIKPVYLNSKSETTEELCKSSDESSSDEEDLLTVPAFESIGSWGTYGINEQIWCDKYRPVVKFKTYEDLILTDLEKTGYLSDRIIASCSSYLENCPVIKQLVLCKCVLNDKKLKNIEILKYHQFLQYLDLSWNFLDDVSELGYLSYLMYLDVSYNALETLLDFKPPHNLTYVNYSYNLISEIKNVSEFWSIKSLNLSHNHILTIQGLHNLKYLENLDLSFNKITILKNLDNLNVVSLNLQNNQIDTCVCDKHLGFKSMPLLTYVRLSHNKLKSLNMLEDAVFLQSLEVQDNYLNDLLEISYLNNLNLLISVNFSSNPITNMENYKHVCLETMKRLRFLDGQSVEIARKLHSDTIFTNHFTSKVNQNFTNLLALSHSTKLPSFGVNVLPSDQPARPLIIIVSPVGSREQKLIKQFTYKNEEHVIRLINHTDREKRNNENDDDYYFVNKTTFTKLLRDGELLMLYDVLNNNYGLTQEEYDRCLTNPGKILITHADLAAALTFRMRGFRPILILAIPETEQIHRQWLMEDFESFVYHLRYPEAAVEITNRDVTIDSSNSSETLTNWTENESTSASVINVSFSETLDSFANSIPKDYSEPTSTLNDSDEIFANETKTYLSYSYRSALYESEEIEIPFNYQISTQGYSTSLMENFYKNIIDTREMYLEFHRQNPGVFYDTVYTNDTQQVFEKLKNAAKFTIKRFLENPVDDDLRDYYAHSIVQNRMKMYRIDSKQSVDDNILCEDKTY